MAASPATDVAPEIAGGRGNTHDGLGDRLANRVHLRSVTTTSNPDTDIDVRELVETDDEERLVELGAQNFRAKELEGAAVDLDETLAVASGVRDRYPGLEFRSNSILGSLMSDTDPWRSSSCRSTGLTALPTF